MTTVTARDITGQTDRTSAVTGVQSSGNNVDTQQGLAAPEQVETQTEKKEDLASSRLAAFARKERAIREAKRALDAQRAEFDSKSQELDALRGFKSKLSEDPLSVLSEAGISYDKLTELALAQGDPSTQELNKLKKEILEVRRQQEESKKLQAEAQEAQVTQALKQISNEVKLMAENNPEYEFIAWKGDEAAQTVAALIKHDFDKTGVLPPTEKIAKEVESMLEEEYLSAAKLKKFQSKFSPQTQAAPSTEKITVQEKQPAGTLTNRINPNTKPQTAKERRERAIAAFLGQNK